MAKNLRARISDADRLVIYDRNQEATTRFVAEAGHSSSNVETPRRTTNIQVANTVREVAENSVSVPFFYLRSIMLHMMSMFYQ